LQLNQWNHIRIWDSLKIFSLKALSGKDLHKNSRSIFKIYLAANKSCLSLRPAFKKSDSSLKMKRQEGVKKFRKREKDLVK